MQTRKISKQIFHLSLYFNDEQRSHPKLFHGAKTAVPTSVFQSFYLYLFVKNLFNKKVTIFSTAMKVFLPRGSSKSSSEYQRWNPTHPLASWNREKSSLEFFLRSVLCRLHNCFLPHRPFPLSVLPHQMAKRTRIPTERTLPIRASLFSLCQNCVGFISPFPVVPPGPICIQLEAGVSLGLSITGNSIFNMNSRDTE